MRQHPGPFQVSFVGHKLLLCPGSLALQQGQEAAALAAAAAPGWCSCRLLLLQPQRLLLRLRLMLLVLLQRLRHNWMLCVIMLLKHGTCQ